MLMQLIIKKIYIVFFLLFFTHSSLANEIFFSLKKNKVNVRYGPSFESEIKYVYKKINLPLKQIDKKENFRRIIDLKNNSGWIHISQLKKNNSVIATKDNHLYDQKSYNFNYSFNVGRRFHFYDCINRCKTYINC